MVPIEVVDAEVKVLLPFRYLDCLVPTLRDPRLSTGDSLGMKTGGITCLFSLPYL